MRKVAVVGAGRVGRTIVHMLVAEEGYEVRVCDADPEAAAALARSMDRVESWPQGVAEKAELARALEGMQAVVSAAPFKANPLIAETADETGVPYLDLTEDVRVTRFVEELAEDSAVAFVPQCGVAPGYVSIAAKHVIEQFDDVDTLTLRTGALPRQPNNRLKYNLTWSTQGLVNEYIHPCEVLRDGQIRQVPPLEDKEEILIDGIDYEAFTTSGGVGSLCRTYEGKIQRLTYKTMRYPGHLELVRFLMHDLRFREHPDELVEIFHRTIPATTDDFVLVAVRGLGTARGRFLEKSFWRIIEPRFIGERRFTGIEISTAAGVCGVLHLLLDGRLPPRGFVKMEDVPYDDFVRTPFGRYYEVRGGE